MGTITINTFKDFSKIYRAINSNNFDNNIDISNYRFLEPKEILILTQYCVLLKNNNIDVNIHCNGEINWYIEAIRLKSFCNTNYNQPSSQGKNISTAIPIKRITVRSMNEYINDAKKFFSEFCNNKDISILEICISELINNVNDHSKSIIDSYIFSQYYHANNRIKFAMADLGIGIPKSVNDYLNSTSQELLSEIEAMKWATEKGKSAKSTVRNMGIGLDNVLSFLKATGSTIDIYSNSALCHMEEQGIITFDKNPISDFRGTLITITVFIEKLDEIDETILEDFTF